jgi:hypothetical protein
MSPDGAYAGEAIRSPERGAIFPSRIAQGRPSARMVGLRAGRGRPQCPPLAFAGEAIMSPGPMAYVEGGPGPSMGARSTCSVLATLVVADLRHRGDARDGGQRDSFVALDLTCGHQSVVLLAMKGEAVPLWPSSWPI